MSGRMQALGDLFGTKHGLDSARGKKQDQFQRQETIKSDILAVLDSVHKKWSFTRFPTQDLVVCGCEDADRLCAGIEAMFLHGLNGPEDRAQSLWRLLEGCAPEHAVKGIPGLHKRTLVGRCRAFIRDMLNTPGGLAGLATVLTEEKSMKSLLKELYHRYAMLKDDDRRTYVVAKLDLMQQLYHFQLRVDHPSLDTWSLLSLRLSTGLNPSFHLATPMEAVPEAQLQSDIHGSTSESKPSSSREKNVRVPYIADVTDLAAWSSGDQEKVTAKKKKKKTSSQSKGETSAVDDQPESSSNPPPSAASHDPETCTAVQELVSNNRCLLKLLTRDNLHLNLASSAMNGTKQKAVEASATLASESEEKTKLHESQTAAMEEFWAAFAEDEETENRKERGGSISSSSSMKRASSFISIYDGAFDETGNLLFTSENENSDGRRGQSQASEISAADLVDIDLTSDVCDASASPAETLKTQGEGTVKTASSSGGAKERVKTKKTPASEKSTSQSGCFSPPAHPQSEEASPDSRAAAGSNLSHPTASARSDTSMDRRSIGIGGSSLMTEDTDLAVDDFRGWWSRSLAIAKVLKTAQQADDEGKIARKVRAAVCAIISIFGPSWQNCLTSATKLRDSRKQFLEKYTTDQMLSTMPKQDPCLEHQCAVCRKGLGKKMKTARVCHMSGQYCCTSCHTGKTSILPSRLMAEFSFDKLPVCDVAYYFLEITERRSWMDPFLSGLPPSHSEVFYRNVAAIIGQRCHAAELHRQLGECGNSLLCKNLKWLTTITLCNHLPLRLFSVKDLLMVRNRMMESMMVKTVVTQMNHLATCPQHNLGQLHMGKRS